MPEPNTPIRIGAIINLQDTTNWNYLDTRGRVQDKPPFKGSPERVFVSTYPSVNRSLGSGSWKIISAEGKLSGAPLLYGDRVHLLNLYAGVGYLDICGYAQSFTPFAGYPNAYGVFTSGGPDRDKGSGTWIIESANGTPTGTGIVEDDLLVLRNAYSGAGYLHTYGHVEQNPAFAEYKGTESFLFVGLTDSQGADSRGWKVTISHTHTPFELDDETKARLIPLTHSESGYQYSIKLEGTALTAAVQGKAMHFDTGSWDICIPEAYVDDSQCTVIEGADANYKPWNLEAVRMKGNFVIKTAGRLVNGELVDVQDYALTDLVFFKLLDNEANQKANAENESNIDRLTGIVGAFPSLDAGTKLPSIAYALADQANAKLIEAEKPQRFGFGMISQPPKAADGSMLDVLSGWSSFQSYLAVSADRDILKYVSWRSDIPLWRTELDFCPEAVPGFSAEVRIPDSDQKIVSASYMATIDTGAPDFTARLRDDNPQLTAPFADHFTKDGADWWPQVSAYADHARSLKNATVKIVFRDDTDVDRFYTYKVPDTCQSPATFFVGEWDSAIPWPIHEPEKPVNRANLGNTIYYYANIMYYDIGRKRVGFAFV